MPDFAAPTFVVLVSLILVYLVTRNKGVFHIILIAFLIRVVFSLVYEQVYPLLTAPRDTVRLERITWEIAEQGIDKWVGNFRRGPYFYCWLNAIIYMVFGRNPLLLRLINALLGSLVAFNVFQIAKLLGLQQRTSRIITWVIAFFPVLIFSSTSMEREAPLTFLFTSGVYQLLKGRRSQNIGNLFLSVFLLGLAAILHGAVLILLIIAITYLTFIEFRNLPKGKMVSLFRPIVTILMVVFCGYLFLTQGLDQFKVTGAVRTIFQQRSIEGVFDIERTEEGRTDYIQEEVHIKSPPALVLHLPLRLVYFLCAPFPWQISAAKDLLGLLDAMFFIVMMVSLFWLKKSAFRHPDLKLILLIIVGYVLIFSLGTSNYGTAIRHRAKVAPLLLCCAVYAYEKRREGKLLFEPQMKKAYNSAQSPVQAINHIRIR